MIVFPLIRSVRLKAATASSRAATLPMFVRRRPFRTRWTSSLNWARFAWDRSKIPGFAGRVSVPDLHGFSAHGLLHGVGSLFLPQVSGAGETPAAPGGVFRIDHDERFNETTHLQYQIRKNGPSIRDTTVE
jgi:hypothetical protein